MSVLAQRGSSRSAAAASPTTREKSREIVEPSTSPWSRAARPAWRWRSAPMAGSPTTTGAGSTTPSRSCSPIRAKSSFRRLLTSV